MTSSLKVYRNMHKYQDIPLRIPWPLNDVWNPCHQQSAKMLTNTSCSSWFTMFNYISLHCAVPVIGISRQVTGVGGCLQKNPSCSGGADIFWTMHFSFHTKALLQVSTISSGNPSNNLQQCIFPTTYMYTFNHCMLLKAVVIEKITNGW